MVFCILSAEFYGSSLWISRRYRNNGKPSEAPTRKVAIMGSQRYLICCFTPSMRAKTRKVIAVTKRSRANNVLVLFANKSFIIVDNEKSPCNNKGINWEYGRMIPKIQRRR